MSAQLLIEKLTGDVVLHPKGGAEASVKHFVVDVTPAVQTVIDGPGGELKWSFNNPEDPDAFADGEVFRGAETTPVPERLLRHQLFVVLSRIGVSYQDLQTAINAMPAGQAKTEALIQLEQAPSFRRDNLLLMEVADILELTPAQVDQLFVDGEPI